MSVLVVAEHDNRALKPATLPAVTAAAEIAAAGAKAVPRTVMILIASRDCTVASALPA